MITNKKVATIRKEPIMLVTYPYGDPSPIPEFGRLYPYNRFDGYTNAGIEQEWEMIVMENEYIKLWINPAVGGKIWGAIEKATGKEFIYFNHVVKFRDVAMRGPWTSGGMEFNMGIIGHTPSCSSPVDHYTRTNDDGSVSCFIGATDWPSRTSWNVEISLAVDSACFTTSASWYNSSGLEQSYYQWNNVGIKTNGNLEYVYPGNKYLAHDGKNFNWPVDENGREISWYDKNNFGEYKSYHVIGSYSDFWGCYWHDDNFGLGHHAFYDDKPGKKIWIWGLSRYGMVWEDLLTDSDGQYTEVQSGKAFNQSISGSSKTPFKHNSFLPYAADTWDEHWFPVKNIGGLSYGNEQLSFYIAEENGTKKLNICANQIINHTLKVEYNGKVVLTEELSLDVMQTASIHLPDFIHTSEFKIWLNNELIYNADEQEKPLSRPVNIPQAYNFDSTQATYIQAKEWERQRFYERAIEQYKACLKQDPFYIEALTGLAGILIKQTQYNESLTLSMTALSVNTYHAEANYLYGVVNTRLSNSADAKDGFSVASQSPAYRSAAYTQLAKLFIKEHQLDKALSYLKKALQYNTQNQQALMLEVVIERLQNYIYTAQKLTDNLLHINPLNHQARFEQYVLGVISGADFKANITSELPYETYLELNSFYFELGLHNNCFSVLELSPEYAMVSIWKAYICSIQNLLSKTDHYIKEAVKLPTGQVFPHREEDIKVLEWAVANYSSWILKYYLALGYIQILKTDEALQLLLSCNNEPDFYVFYVVRANLQRTINEQQRGADLKTAYVTAPEQWRTALLLSKQLSEQNRWNESLDVAEAAYNQTKENYYLGLQLAACYMYTSRFEDGIRLMKNLVVLPNEGASAGRNIWKDINLFAALKAIDEQQWEDAVAYIHQSKQWPENLGVGKPYTVDERLEDFLELYCLQQSRQTIPVELTDSITQYRDKFPATPFSSNDFLAIYVLQLNNDFHKAQYVLNEWIKTDNGLAAKWALAVLNDNIDKVNKLASIQPEKREALPYEILFEDRSFDFVKEMYNKNFFKLNNKALI